MKLHHVRLDSETDFEGFRRAARALLAAGIAPEHTSWSAGTAGDLFGSGDDPLPPDSGPAPRVPRDFVALCQLAMLHREPRRFALLYRLLWRLQREPGLLALTVDADVAELSALAKSVRRDLHKMKAFVRFREIATDTGPHFVAWFEPEHHIVEAIASFFVRRFAAMRWSILTPEASLHWQAGELLLGPGATRGEAPAEDAHEDLWRAYYAHIFNPARLKVNAMRAEMPKKYWKNLPEAALIAELSSAAGRRQLEMTQAMPTTPHPATQAARRGRALHTPEATPMPASTLAGLRAEALGCRGCPLWAGATQTVFGEGPESARVVLVGEQPGDREDLAGHPFVGPAGQLLDRALRAAGIARERLYVTNAVKHFKNEPRGKRRLHRTPAERDILACRPWLEQELALLQPALVVALGATAAQALSGRRLPVEANRGRILDSGDGAPPLLVTVHPSYLLRMPEGARDAAYAQLVEDLRRIRSFL